MSWDQRNCSCLLYKFLLLLSSSLSSEYSSHLKTGSPFVKWLTSILRWEKTFTSLSDKTQTGHTQLSHPHWKFHSSGIHSEQTENIHDICIANYLLRSNILYPPLPLASTFLPQGIFSLRSLQDNKRQIRKNKQTKKQSWDYRFQTERNFGGWLSQLYHFTQKESEAQVRWVTCPRSHPQQELEPGLGVFASKPKCQNAFPQLCIWSCSHTIQ